MEDKVKENYRFFVSHKDELLKKYRDKFVIIINKKIVGSFESFDEALRYSEQEKLIPGEYFLDQVSTATFESKAFISRVAFYS